MSLAHRIGVVVVAMLLAVLSGCGRQPSDGDGGPGLSVSNSAARSCDLVLALEGDRELKVKFLDHVLGSSFQRGARVGVSVAAKADKALGRFTKSLGEGVSIEKTRCFSRAGDVLQGTEAAFQ